MGFDRYGRSSWIFLVSAVCLIGRYRPWLILVCSPMTANIYFPAIPLLSQDFGISVSLINLTVTVYLIFQGICEYSLWYRRPLC